MGLYLIKFEKCNFVAAGTESWRRIDQSCGTFDLFLAKFVHKNESNSFKRCYMSLISACDHSLCLHFRLKSKENE